MQAVPHGYNYKIVIVNYILVEDSFQYLRWIFFGRKLTALRGQLHIPKEALNCVLAMLLNPLCYFAKSNFYLAEADI